MKIAIITDIHYGIRNDYIPFLENNKKFFEEIFFPTLKKEGIDVIVCLGDVVERRKYTNSLTADYLKNDFLNKVRNDFAFTWILGNHDIFYRNSCKVNIANILGFYAYDEAKTITWIDGIKTLFIPWICDENRDQVFREIESTDAKIAFGHLELQGFQMNSGTTCKDGLSSDIFKKFDIVLSGHFHHKSSQGNVHYLGSHAQFTWSDYGDERGFHIFDTLSRKLQFIKNPYTVFSKVFYDDSKGVPPPPLGGFETLEKKIVRVIISGKNDPAQYDNFISRIERVNPLDIIPVEDHHNINLTGEEEIVSDTKDTIEIIREFVQQSNNVVNVEKLDNLIVGLYQEAQLME